MIPFMPYSDLYTLNLDWLLKKAGEYDQLFKGVTATAKAGDSTNVIVKVNENGGYEFDFTIAGGGSEPVEKTVAIHKTRFVYNQQTALSEYSKIIHDMEYDEILPVVMDSDDNFYTPAIGNVPGE